MVTVALALGSEGTTLWTGRASTRTAFSLTGVRCASNDFAGRRGLDARIWRCRAAMAATPAASSRHRSGIDADPAAQAGAA